MPASAIEIERALRVRYPEKSYAFLAQLRNATGYKRAQRYADALVMSLWPSRGLHLTGFEIKIYRNDWLRELKDGEKADAIAQYCHFWYVVAGDETIIKPDEVPVTWGLMVHHQAGRSPKIIKEAPLNPNPTPIDYLFLASILRKQTAEVVPLDELNRSVYNEGVTHGRKLQSQDNVRAEGNHTRLKESLAEFEKISGLKINEYNGHRLGELVKKLQEALNFDHRAKSLRQMAESILKELAEYEKPIPTTTPQTPPSSVE